MLGPATAMVAKPAVTPRTSVVVAVGATVPESGAVACSTSGFISESVGAASVDAGACSGAGAGAVPAGTVTGQYPPSSCGWGTTLALFVTRLGRTWHTRSHRNAHKLTSLRVEAYQENSDSPRPL